MKPIVYENIKTLSYGELLNAISNIKENISKGIIKIDDKTNTYYSALVDELDNRNRQI